MEKQEYARPELEFVALYGDLVATVSGTAGSDNKGDSVDVPGMGGDGDGSDFG